MNTAQRTTLSDLEKLKKV